MQRPKSEYIANTIERILNTADDPAQRRIVVEKIAVVLARTQNNQDIHNNLIQICDELEQTQAGAS